MDTAEKAKPRITAKGMSGFTAGPFGLHRLALGKAFDALGESVFGD